MENASKALIIAGEILIAVIILSILVAVIMVFGNYSSDMHKKIADQETYQFNENFLSYAGRVNITAQEIATIINFAKKENDKNNLSRTNVEHNESYIDVLIDGKSFFKNKITSDNYYDDNIKFTDKVNAFVQENNTKYFSCQAEPSFKLDSENSNLLMITGINGDLNDIQYNSQKKVNIIKFNEITDYGVISPKNYKGKLYDKDRRIFTNK